MKFLLSIALLFCVTSAHAIPELGGIDFGSPTCTGLYRLGPNYTFNCTTGELVITTVTAQALSGIVTSTSGFTMQELHLSTQAIQGLVDAGFLQVGIDTDTIKALLDSVILSTS